MNDTADQSRLSFDADLLEENSNKPALPPLLASSRLSRRQTVDDLLE